MNFQEKTGEDLYHQALTFHQKGDLENAIAEYHKALASNPDLTVAYSNLGAIYYSKNQLDKAIELWEVALKKEPSSVDILVNLGAAHAQKRDYRTSAFYLDKAIEIAPERTEAAFNLAQAFLQMGNYPKALATLEEITNKEPAFPPAFLTAANVYMSSGNFEKAEKVLSKLLEKVPDHPEALVNLGHITYETGRISEAKDFFHRAVSRHPSHYPSLLSFGKFLCDQGDPGNGLMYLEKASQINPDDWTLEVHKGNAFQQNGQFEKAITAYQKALRLNPGDIGTRRNLSRVLSRFVPPWHLKMLADSERNQAYEEAIAKAVTEDTVALDIGAGSGLLSLMAARHGAKKVIACELSPYLAQTAREIITQNGAASKIELHNVKSTQLSFTHQPQKPNLLVAEIFDSGLIGEMVLPTFRHALKELCTEDCTVIPARAEVYGRLVNLPDLAAVSPIKNIRGFDLSPFDQYRIPGEYISDHLSLYKHEFLSERFDIMSFDFKNPEPVVPEDRPVSHVLEIEASQSGTWNAVVFWFNLWLDDEIQISSAPDRSNNHWHQAIYFFDEAEEIQKGQKIKINACRNDSYIWFDKTQA